MKISWVLANSTVIDPTVDIEKLKNIGPLWGSWRTWRSYNTDNVVCYTEPDVRNLIAKNFHNLCNLYIPDWLYSAVDRPPNVKLYQGEFHQTIDNPDEIVSMHLASSTSNIVLLIGFDLSPRNLDQDKLAKHKWHNYIQYFINIVKSNPDIQWVVVDHGPDIEKEVSKLSNLQFDTLPTILGS